MLVEHKPVEAGLLAVFVFVQILVVLTGADRGVEIAVGDNYRTIRIQLEEGDGEVIIVGTYVIPEFGSVVIIILVVAVSSAIIISKSRFSVRYN